jgi:hypothetical protein
MDPHRFHAGLDQDPAQNLDANLDLECQTNADPDPSLSVKSLIILSMNISTFFIFYCTGEANMPLSSKKAVEIHKLF